MVPDSAQIAEFSNTLLFVGWFSTGAWSGKPAAPGTTTSFATSCLFMRQGKRFFMGTTKGVYFVVFIYGYPRNRFSKFEQMENRYWLTTFLLLGPGRCFMAARLSPLDGTKFAVYGKQQNFARR